jgi:hypothetical protein
MIARALAVVSLPVTAQAATQRQVYKRVNAIGRVTYLEAPSTGAEHMGLLPHPRQRLGWQHWVDGSPMALPPFR